MNTLNTQIRDVCVMPVSTNFGNLNDIRELHELKYLFWQKLNQQNAISVSCSSSSFRSAIKFYQLCQVLLISKETVVSIRHTFFRQFAQSFHDVVATIIFNMYNSIKFFKYRLNTLICKYTYLILFNMKILDTYVNSSSV